MKTVVLLLGAVLAAPAAQVTTGTPTPQRFFIEFAVEDTADAWRHADAVVHLRIEDSKPKALTSSFPGLEVTHTATVIAALKTHSVGGPTGRTFTFVQSGSSNERPYSKGEEFIAFLHWWPSTRVFERSCGPASVYAVRDGRVTWLNWGRGIPTTQDEMTVEEFIARLRATK